MTPPSPAAPGGDAAALLDEALAALPAPEREAVVRRHLLGEEPPVVAAALGCAEGTVHSRTSRGLERMRAWFSRRGIACTAAALVLCCGEARAAAAALAPEAAPTCAVPTHAATALAAASQPVIAVGALLMAIAVLATAALAAVLLAAPAATAPAADPVSAGMVVRLYDATDLYQGEAMDFADEVRQPRPEGGGPPPPAPDPRAVADLDAARNLQRICDLVAARAGTGSRACMVDAGMSDEELGGGLPAELAVPRVRDDLRMRLANMQPRIPGMDVPRTLLLAGSVAGQARVAADLGAVRRLRRERLLAEPGMRAVIAAAMQAGMAPDGPHPAVLPRDGGEPFAVIWLPEESSPLRPSAVACDGRRSLLIYRRRITCHPDLRPAAMAMALRQGLDRGAIHAPLTAEAWGDVAAQAVIDLGPQAPQGPFPARLAEILARAGVAAPTRF